MNFKSSFVQKLLFWSKEVPKQKFVQSKIEVGKIVIQMKGITKRFPGVVANDGIDLDFKAGEIHAILGENGAGKTTLMNILYGLLQPDEGEIFIHGRRVILRSPKDAIDLGIGMVHQHFMLINQLTVTENIILGLQSSREPLLDIHLAEKKVSNLSAQYSLKIDPKAKIWQLSVGEQQRVEIIKALYRGAQVLILDEPTSVLTPPEIKELTEIMRRMAKEGCCLVPFITHKLPEVMAVSDRVTVLRRGRVVAGLSTASTSKTDLAKSMVGREVLFQIEKPPVNKGEVVLEVKELRALNDKGLPALKSVSFTLREGEILGIAGVAGNGQSELVEVITGLRKATGGQVFIKKKDMTNRSPREIIEEEVGHIPEKRIERGLVRDFSVADNIVLEVHSKPPFANGFKKLFLNASKVSNYAEELIRAYDIKTPSKDTPVKHLSGGNLQRLILARELSRNPKLIVAAQPTGGLDVGATEYVRLKLVEQRGMGVAVLLISEDLEEIMSLSDRVAVMYEGEIVGMIPAAKVEVEEIGLMMAGAKRMPSIKVD